MRVLALVTDAFGGRGGIAKFNRDLITAICNYPKCKELIAIPRSIEDPYGSLPPNLTYVDKYLHSKIRYIAFVLKRVFDKPRFDLILCGHINLLPLGFLLKVITGSSIILCVHGIDVWHPTKSILSNLSVRKIDAFISVSKLTKKRFLKWAGLEEAKGFILPNAVNLTKFKPGPKPAVLLNKYGLQGKTVLMTLGRLEANEHYKGVDEVLELLPKLVERMPNLVYLVAGDGTDRQRLMKKVHKLSLQNTVVFTGFIPEQEKVDYYRLGDAFLMPGRGEGFGIVLLEAMACGIPVVASKIDGSREAVLDGEIGTLVDPDKPGEIEEGIIEALKYGRGTVTDRLDHFSYKKFEERCHNIIVQAIGR